MIAGWTGSQRVLANPSVQLVLLTSGPLFRGAVATIPSAAPATARAIEFAEHDPDTIGPDEPASVAFERAAANPRFCGIAAARRAG
jgi:hypothetical protein